MKSAHLLFLFLRTWSLLLFASFRYDFSDLVDFIRSSIADNFKKNTAFHQFIVWSSSSEKLWNHRCFNSQLILFRFFWRYKLWTHIKNSIHAMSFHFCCDFCVSLRNLRHVFESVSYHLTMSTSFTSTLCTRKKHVFGQSNRKPCLILVEYGFFVCIQSCPCCFFLMKIYSSQLV